MRITTILAVLITGIAATSCKHYCMSNATPVIRLVNFDSADLNTVVVKTYANDGKFTNPQSTTIYTSRWTGPSTVDTQSFFASNFSPANSMPLDFFTDATVTIAATGKTYYIRGVDAHHDTWKNVDCTSSLSYYLNDTMHTIAMQPQANQQGVIDISK